VSAKNLPDFGIETIDSIFYAQMREHLKENAYLKFLHLKEALWAQMRPPSS
jgi:hypothetical protein